MDQESMYVDYDDYNSTFEYHLLDMDDCVKQKEDYSMLSIYLCGYMLTPLCVIGMVGNIVCGTTVIRKYLQGCVFRFYCHALWIADTGILISALIIIAIPRVTQSTTHMLPFFVHATKIAYPLGMISLSMSSWTILLMSLLRCLSLYIPFVLRRSMSNRRSVVAVIITMFVAVLYNLPRFLELKIQRCYDVDYDSMGGDPPSASPSGAVEYRFEYVIGPSEIRNNSLYRRIYLGLMYTVFIFGIPFIVISICNILTTCKVFKVSKLRQHIPRNRRRLSKTLSEINELNVKLVTALLTTISILFLLCNVTPLFANIIEITLIPETRFNTTTGKPISGTVPKASHTHLINMLTDIGNFLICVNASFNFMVYLMFSGRLRAKLYSVTNNFTPGQVRSAPLASVTTCGGETMGLMTDSAMDVECTELKREPDMSTEFGLG